MRIPVVTAILMIILSIAVDWYIFSDIRRIAAAKTRRVLSWAYGVFTLLCWSVLVVFLCWPKRNPEVSILTPMWLLFSYLSVYIPKFIYALISLLGRLLVRKRTNQQKWNIGGALPLAILIFVIIWIGALSTRRRIEINRVEIVSDRLPESMDSLTVLQFSDIHLGSWGNDTTFISALVDSINACHADVVMFTGDIVNRTASELKPFIPVLGRIKAPLGVYAVLGNHDYGGYADWPDDSADSKNMQTLKEGIASLGWKLLCNQSVMVGNETDSIAVIGVENWGEPPFNQVGDLVKAYPSYSAPGRQLNDSIFKILLTHNPNHWNQVVTDISNVDLSLAGHTHAMQMAVGNGRLQWSPAVWKYKSWGGLYDTMSKEGTPMFLYVNIGAGEVGFPARIGTARPEINIITIRTPKTDTD